MIDEVQLRQVLDDCFIADMLDSIDTSLRLIAAIQLYQVSGSSDNWNRVTRMTKALDHQHAKAAATAPQEKQEKSK